MDCFYSSVIDVSSIYTTSNVSSLVGHHLLLRNFGLYMINIYECVCDNHCHCMVIIRS
jgi:hypothetical protein